MFFFKSPQFEGERDFTINYSFVSRHHSKEWNHIKIFPWIWTDTYKLMNAVLYIISHMFSWIMWRELHNSSVLLYSSIVVMLPVFTTIIYLKIYRAHIYVTWMFTINYSQPLTDWLASQWDSSDAPLKIRWRINLPRVLCAQISSG